MTCYLHHSNFKAFKVTKLAGIFQIHDWVAIEAEIQFNPSCITSSRMSERPVRPIRERLAYSIHGVSTLSNETSSYFVLVLVGYPKLTYIVREAPL